MGNSPRRGSALNRVIIVVIIAIMIALVALLIARLDLSRIGISPRLTGDTVVTGVIGSEKQPFFDAPAVQEIFAENYLEVRVEPVGSRRIATDVDLSDMDFAFPSSEPAADKIARDHEHVGVSTPFESPMAVATFTPIMELLEGEGLTSMRDGHWVIDLERFVDLSDSSVRWRDLGDTYPSPRAVQISTTDIRTSNSAAMYLSVLAWILNDSRIASAVDTDRLTDEIAPYFITQGYTESTSAGPFEDYLTQGMGSKPMVMVYEAQFLGEAIAENSRITDDMTLAYLSPTTMSSHTIVELTGPGAELARLLREDEELQRLAAEHGFRPLDSGVFDSEIAAHGARAPSVVVDTVDLPDYDVLETLIDGVGAHFSSPAPPTELEEVP